MWPRELIDEYDIVGMKMFMRDGLRKARVLSVEE